MENTDPLTFDWEVIDQQKIKRISQIQLEMGQDVELSIEEPDEPGCVACAVA
jgi:hypothetical protein